MGKVFVVQVPLKRNREGEMVPAADPSPAAAYGDIEVLLPPRAVTFTPAVMMQQLREKLKDFSDDDYLVALGDPTAIGAACIVAAEMNRGKVSMLKWNRQTSSYIKVTLN